MTLTVKVEGTGPFNSAVSWLVNDIPGGNANVGTISASGVYTAPSNVPNPNPVTITAKSVQDSTKSDNAAARLYSLVVTPSNPNVFYGHSQQFTAQVTGLDNPTVQFFMKFGFGKITIDGFYTATVPNDVETDTITTTVLGGGSSVDTRITLTIPPPLLTSITPSPASAGETVTIDGQDLYGVDKVFFPGPLGSTLKADIQDWSFTQVTAKVPLGAVDGSVYMTLVPVPGVNTTSNNIAFGRLPNVRIRTSAKDLSPGETLQFNYRTLGASSPNSMTWTAGLGHINANGLYRAPSVSQETFDRVTGCLQNTRSCDEVMLRIVPLRISPDQPVVNIGDTLQLQAVEGSPVSADWSVLAGGGSITSGGLFSAPLDPLQAGGIPVSATASGTTGTALIAVAGGFPGTVSRTSDYLDLRYDADKQRYLQHLEGTDVRFLAVAGNRAYVLDQAVRFNGNFEPTPPFHAIEAYDISDPIHPTWLGAAEAVSSWYPYLFSAYDHYVFEVDTVFYPSYANPPSRVMLYDVQSGTPRLVSLIPSTPELATAHTNDGRIYAVPVDPYTGSTVPIYVYDIRGGTIQPIEYDVTPPPEAIPGNPPAEAIGTGNMLYVDFDDGVGNLTLAAYDISGTPPNLVGTLSLGSGFFVGYNVLIRGNLLFVGKDIFDISQPVPALVGSMQIQSVQDVQGSSLLGRGFQPIYAADDNYVLVDISNPANPVMKTSLYNMTNSVASQGKLTGNGRYLLTADAVGGFATIDLSAAGGTIDKSRIGVFPNGYIFDHTINNQSLYVAGPTALGTGAMEIFDLGTGTPVYEGIIQYGQNAAFAVQVKGTTAFLGMLDSLKVVDVSNATNPVEADSLAIATNALALSGNVLFDGTRDSKLIALDITSPTSPATLSIVSLPSSAITLRLVGNRLFISDGPAGLLIFDVSNPAAPVRLGQLSLATPVWDAAISGTMAVLAADASGLVIADISNPASPKQISQTVLETWAPFAAEPRSIALSVAIQNGLVYVGTANSLSLVFGFDCSEPAYPRLVSMNAFGEFIDSIVSGFSFLGNDILVFGGLGVWTDMVQADASQPRNVVNLYYPPMNLRGGLGPVRKSKAKAFVHPKFDRDLLKRKHRYLKGGSAAYADSRPR